MTERHTDEIFVHLEYIKVGIDELKAGQKALNGRMSQTEQDIAVLHDRADEGRASGRTWGLTAGGIGTAIGAALAYFFGTADK